MSDHLVLSQIVASHCCVCRAPLTDAESIEHGIGPVCSGKYYNPMHTPDDTQVKTAIGVLVMSDFPDTIVDSFLTVINNDRVNARHGSNLMVKWASAHYTDRDVVLKCALIVRALGYKELANKLEEDRTQVTVIETPNKFEVFVPDRTLVERDIKAIPGSEKMHKVDGSSLKLGKKVGWTIPLDQYRYFETIIGVHCGNELMGGTGGIKVITKKHWTDIIAFRDAKSKQSGGFVQISTNAVGKLEVYSPFNQGFIAGLKACVPSRDRAWTGRCWTVSPVFIEAVKKLVLTHYDVSL